MADNKSTVLIYLFVAAIIVFWPFVVLSFRSKLSTLFQRLSFLSGDRVFGLPSKTIGIGLGMALSYTLLWWKTVDDRMFAESLAVSALMFIAGLFLIGFGVKRFLWIRPAAGKYLAAAIAIMLAGYLSFSSGILSHTTVSLVAWHHWSAYIGPSELLGAGGRIFYDFPAQYGFGPTALLVSACEGGCWLGMYYIVSVTTFAFFLLVFYCLVSQRCHSFVEFTLLLIVAIAVCFFWNAYPPSVSSPRMVPSVQGLRFLPPLFLVSIQIFIETRQQIARYWAGAGHVCYAIGVLWSPEAFFMVGAIWAPYYCLRRFSESPAVKRRHVLFQSAGTVASIPLLVCVIFVIVYWAAYGVLPSVKAYLIYILYPPGPLPIDPAGPVWFVGAAILLGTLFVSKKLLAGEDVKDVHRELLFLFFAYAALVYCMGRGHSNNFLNILPPVFLMLICGLRPGVPLIHRWCSTAMILSLVAYLNMFGWAAWLDSYRDGKLFAFSPASLISEWSYDNQATAASLDRVFGTKNGKDNFADLNLAVSQLSKASNDPLTVIDQYYLLDPKAKGVWSAFNGNGNYAFMPAKSRKIFLQNSLETIGRSGWLVVENGYPSEWIADFDAIYLRGEQKSFGRYTAIHFSKK